MLVIDCYCPACQGEDEGYSPDIIRCIHCGQDIWTGESALTCAEGELHLECLADYCFSDATREELLTFAESVQDAFTAFMSDLRNLRRGGGRGL